MAAYLIVNVKISNPEAYQEYRNRVAGVFQQFGGKAIVRSPEYETWEGTSDFAQVVVLEFPSMDQARAFWNAEEYTPVKALRQGHAELTVIAVEGAA